MSYYISPRFEDKLAVHITKNYLDLPNVRVPLILGIHGRKGEGKSFQCELVFEKMGVEVTHISGGELESPDAGDPARLIRLRYRETAELIKVRGKMCVLMINDLDAGAGRFDEGTQYTVNTQLVNATLMNIADNPTDVQLPGSYDSTPLHRVPIIVTGNDFSTLYAPLIRDGRMDKFYWEPNRDDKIGIVGGIFSEDGLSQRDVEQLVDNFPFAAVDFYSALRSRIYDQQIQQFIHNAGIDKVSSRVVNSNDVPSFKKPNFGLSDLMEMANLMVNEQKWVDDSRLVEEYNRGALRHQKHFIPTAAQTPVYEARPTANFDGEPISTYHARPTANFDGEPIPTYQARVSYQAQAEAVKIPQLPSSHQSVNQGTNPMIKDTSTATTHVGPEILSYMQKILASGNHLSIEYADKDSFSKGDWQRFSNHEIDDMADAIGDLERCLVSHNEDYVRVAGIDYKTKLPVMETIIQNPNEKNSGSTFRYPPTQHQKQLSSDSTFRYPSTTQHQQQLSSDSSFHYPPTTTQHESKQSSDSTFRYPATTQHQQQLSSDSSFHYPPTTTQHESKQSSDSTFRYPATTQHQQQLSSDSSFHYPPTTTQHESKQSSDSTFRYPPTTTVSPFPAPHTAFQSGENRTLKDANQYNPGISTAHVELEILEQMREILASGNHIGIEYVDQRRFYTGSWKSFAGHQIEDMADAIATLEACLVEHNNDYVRIFGIEPQAKRRLREIIVQRPNGKLVHK
ncbi:ribulose bisphosphate carboxylase small subunit [Plectonema radiosum]|uniref:ribulose bisphosphate carboxylase small subunit n=1 Tax=Plectonema radiosum TaxID=945768 RepID=UPI0035C93C10